MFYLLVSIFILAVTAAILISGICAFCAAEHKRLRESLRSIINEEKRSWLK